MSPRSEELMASARDRLAAARATVEGGFHSAATSAAYYAMLYAARAALSEEDRNAKTHAGTWALFRETMVTSGRIDESLFSEVHRIQQLREATDYDALMIPPEEAERIVLLAERFLALVVRALEA